MTVTAVIVTESMAKVPMMHLLWKSLDQAGLHRSQVNVLAAVPEDKRDCKRRDITGGRHQLTEAIDLLRAAEERRGRKLAVMLLGNVPLEAVTDAKGIKQKRGRPWEENGVVYLPCLTPGNAAYDERVMPVIDADCRLFADIAKTGNIPREERLEWTIVDTRAKFDLMLRDLRGTVSFDIETTGLHPWQKEIRGEDGEIVERAAKVISIGFGCRERQWCLPFGHDQFESFGMTDRQMIAHIDRRLRHCFLVAHNGKFDSLYLRVLYGVRWQVDFDTMLAHWMIDENQKHALKLLATMYTGAPNYDADLDLKRGTDGDIYKHCLYLAHDVYYTRTLKAKFAKLLDEDGGVKRAFEKIVMPIARLFVDIEFNGVLIDIDRFEEAEAHIRGQLAAAEKDVRAALLKSGIPAEDVKKLNIRSTQQLAEILFDRLKIKTPGKKNKKGELKMRSTAESVLKQLDHPVCAALMKHRGADQQLKMFIEGWKPYLVKHEDGWRLHPRFKLHGTVTGRASCECPNLQQVPRDPVIRSLIIAARGWELLDVDLSQIEMRLAAELSGDQTLLGIFLRDEDVHWNTALKEITRGAGMAEQIQKTALAFCAKWPEEPWLLELCKKANVKPKYAKRLDYGLAAQIVHRMGPDLAADLLPEWKELRKKAKAINFGYLFGMWWKKMIDYARDNYGVKLTEKQAQDSRKSFFETYKELGPWHERQKRYARRHGYVRSLSGAKRRLPLAMSNEDTPKRGEALRQAVNSPVQRFACELNFMVLLQLCEEFGWDVVRPNGTVHDAILIECRLEWVERVARRYDEIVQHPSMLDELGIALKVPIKGDCKIGPWSKGVSLAKWMKARAERADRKAKT